MFRIFNLIMLLAAFGSGICGVCARSQEAPKPAIAPQSPLPPDTKPVSHWDTKNALVVPFEYDPAKDNSPAVWLRINDSKPQLFIVDTGVYLPFILDAGSAATMQIVYPAKEVEVGGSKYSRLDGAKITWRFPATKTSAAKDVPLPLASLTGEPLLKNSIFITAETQGVIAETMGEYSAPIVGIIGGGFLRQAYGAVQFDFVCREMTLYPKTVPPLRVPGAATVPMHLKDVYNAIFVLAGNGSLHEMIVDTGAYEVVIPDALAGEFSMLNMTHESGTGPIIGGTSESFQCLLPQLRIGSLIEKDIKAEREVKGLGLLLLGMNFFSRFRVTLDYTHNELTLERAANYLDRSRAPGAVDFLVEMQNGVMRVTLVDSDGGAAKAGVKEGDILLEINGMATQKMTDAEAMLKMKGAKGETIKAVLQRPDGKKYAITYQIRGFFDKRPKSMEPQIGFTVITSSELRFFVATVSPDSPAQEAGLQTGDEILEVNGEKVTLEYIKTAAKLPPHKVGDVAVIKIQRKGEDKPREFRLVYRLLK